MPFNISFYQDQVMADGVSDIALEPLPRVVYVREANVVPILKPRVWPLVAGLATAAAIVGAATDRTDRVA
ncbi:hypothetical protein [Candidatus Poriferisodalis sp.]|uniref:hypothetical protein n=1 Tax=Candidatus Poriferisodalis sp. TaxID=3101277 RepID=UPI003B52471F